MAVVLEYGLPDRRVAIAPADIDLARANNQFLFNGTSIQFPESVEDESKYIAFIEYIEGTGYTVTTNETTPKNVIPSRSTPLAFDMSGLRMDKGFRAAGTGVLVKGFFVKI